MTAKSQLLTTIPKTKTKANQANTQNRNRTTEMEITWRVIHRETGESEGERGGKGIENKQHKWQVENREAKELI